MNNPLYMITESTAQEVEFNIVNENRNFVIAEGIIQEAESENRNKRCYSRDDLFKEITCPRQQELVQTGNFKGEAGHPMDVNLARQQTIDPRLVQVWYTKLWMDGNYVKAQFRGTNNDLGRSFNEDLIDGQKPSFSLRALGRIENIRGKAYVKGLKIVTYDRVYYPSHNKAYTQKLIGSSDNKVLANTATITPNLTPKSVKEAGNDMILTESGIVTPVYNESIRNYLISESANIDFIRKNFDTLYESIMITEDGKNVILRTSDYDTILVPIEKHISNQIMEYCSKL